MDFIEHWLHISPNGGSGVSEALILAVPIAIGLILASLRGTLPRSLIQYLEQLGNREGSERFDK